MRDQDIRSGQLGTQEKNATPDPQKAQPDGVQQSKTTILDARNKFADHKRIVTSVAKRPKNSLSRIAARYREQNEIRRDYEFMPSTIEVLDRPPSPFSRAMLVVVILLSAFAIGWATYAQTDIVVNATGVVVPKGKVKVVQPIESGVVTAIHVRDGQLVKKGELLVTMDSSDSIADVNSLTKELLVTQLTAERLEAQLAHDETIFSPPGKTDQHTVSLQKKLLHESLLAEQEHLIALEAEISRNIAERDSIRSNLQRLEQSLPLMEKLYNKKSIMAKKGLIPEAEFLEAQINMNDSLKNLEMEKNRLKEVEARFEKATQEKHLAKSEYRRELLSQLADTKNKQATLIQQLAKAESRQFHRELKAPVEGIVQQLSINTIGGVVTAAQPLMVVVPIEGGLEIDAKVLNKDIGLILKDQDVSVKVTAYPYTRYGDLKGTIEWIAQDAVVDPQMGPIYPIRVSVKSYKLPHIINKRQGILTPGMTVTTDVKVGTRRVIQYFLAPIMRYSNESLREN